jgi:hypothetical protein
MHQWVSGSNSRGATLLKLTVKSEFALVRPVYQRRDFAIRPSQIASLRPVVRRMYRDTQADLSRRGISNVQLFRGVKSPVIVGDVLESWTTDLPTARVFGSYDVLVEIVPAERVFMYYQGPGWVAGPFGQQFEYLVLSEVPK